MDGAPSEMEAPFEEFDGEGELVTGEDGLMYREIEVREQDRFLPVANIARIMKKVLPNNAKIAKDGKETIQNCVSEFISFITSEASEKCQQEKRKTINGDDILWAMSTLGMDKYIEPLRTYLGKYRESVKGDKPEKKTPSSAGKRDAAAALAAALGGGPLKKGNMGDDMGSSASVSAPKIPANVFGQTANSAPVPGTIFEGPTPGTHQVLREDGTYATVRYVNPDGTPFTGDLSQVAAINHQPIVGGPPPNQASSVAAATAAALAAQDAATAAAAAAAAAASPSTAPQAQTAAGQPSSSSSAQGAVAAATMSAAASTPGIDVNEAK